MAASTHCNAIMWNYFDYNASVRLLRDLRDKKNVLRVRTTMTLSLSRAWKHTWSNTIKGILATAKF